MPKSTAEGNDEGKDVRKITKDEAAFILGAQGRTKMKLSNVSGTVIDLVEAKGDKFASQLEIKGGAKERARAMKYIDYVISQRLGPVNIDESSHPDDLTILKVPAETVSLITGAKGAYLRHVEEEWWTLLFFLQVDPKNPPRHVPPGHFERLAIFGPSRARRGAELKVMAAIESKLPGYFTKNAVAHDSPTDGFDTDTMFIANEDYSYALGKNGNTRKKLARASGCIVEYIGNMAYCSGLKRERQHAREYLTWLLHQRVGQQANVDHTGRDDVTMILVKRNCIGYVTGTRGAALRAVEEETSTFCFIEGGADDNEDAEKPLLIFGRQEDRRLAENLVWERIQSKFDEVENGRDYGRKGKGRKGKGEKGDDFGKGKGKKDGKNDGFGKGDSNGAAIPEPVRPTGPGIDSDFKTITDEDAAFIMGQGGKTKRKLAAVSGAFLEITPNCLEIRGKKDARDRAKQYVDVVMKQRLGPVKMEDIEHHKDMSIVEVPAEAVSFVTGKGGAFLRMVEEEFGTLLFFIDYNKARRHDQPERLAIFGPLRERRGAELKVMATIEMKIVNHFTNRDIHLPMKDPQEGFGTDRMNIPEDDYSYALGKNGSTRKKIARASCCIIEYIGRHAYLAGTRAERVRAREYLTWLFRQRIGPVEVVYEGRTDVNVLPVPKDCVGFVTGHKGLSLRAVEDETHTFCFIEGGRDDPHRDPKPLLIFGQAEARKAAEVVLKQRIDQKLKAGWVHEEWADNAYGDYNKTSGKGDRSGRQGDGARRPNAKGAGKGGGKDWPSASAPDTTEPEAGPPVEAANQEQEEDEAWGDWGGASDEEPDDVGPTAVAPSAGSDAYSTPAASFPKHTPSGAAKWSEQPVPMQFKAERLKGDQELDLPPQLVHEEAWPELGGLGAKPKKGKKH